eukprot:SM000082S22854  [mRNA]  locus=s82:327890:328674:+ [translate_table: standard]
MPRLKPVGAAAGSKDGGGGGGAGSLESSTWEEFDVDNIAQGAKAALGASQALRWLVWPGVDEKSAALLATRCPGVVLNPSLASLPPSLRREGVPPEAQPGVALDAPFVEGLDPATWVASAGVPSSKRKVDWRVPLPLAERFRLAYVARDDRLAPKRAKNQRQQARRAERAFLNSDTDFKARALAGSIGRHLRLEHA